MHARSPSLPRKRRCRPLLGNVDGRKRYPFHCLSCVIHHVSSSWVSWGRGIIAVHEPRSFRARFFVATKCRVRSRAGKTTADIAYALPVKAARLPMERCGRCRSREGSRLNSRTFCFGMVRNILTVSITKPKGWIVCVDRRDDLRWQTKKPSSQRRQMTMSVWRADNCVSFSIMSKSSR